MNGVDPFAPVGSNEVVELVDPFALKVEWAVDEDHVAALAKDIEECGKVLVPVMVWGPERKIADGFHRVAAAQCAKESRGYPQLIPTIVLNEPEWRFWEIRILSARQHEKVEESRMLSWAYHCWRTGPWGSLELIKILDTWRWEKRYPPQPQFDLGQIGEEEFRQICSWIKDKAKQWGVREHKLVDAIVLDHVLRTWELTAGERYLVRLAISTLSLPLFQEFLAKWRLSRNIGYREAKRVLDSIATSPKPAEEEDRLRKAPTLDDFLAQEKRPRVEFTAADIARRLLNLCEGATTLLEGYGDQIQTMPRTKESFQTIFLELMRAAADVWPDPFAVWYQRIAPPEVEVSDEHLALPSSVVEARD